MGLCLVIPFAVTPFAFAKAPKADGYYDVYLTGGRVCRQCTWRVLNQTQVELTNRGGIRGVYPRIDILGVDDHPVLRKVYQQHLQGIGLPARVLVPQAFEDEDRLRYYETQN
ncbi:MAG: hypothetical protein KTR14_11630 [Vampirovibrio sp.]|nr:hypothetical protein [Vampirovibrio sp.]